VTDVTTYDTEVDCLAGLLSRSGPGDVVGLMCHAQRQEVYDWIAAHGGSSDDPARLAHKVRAATSQGETPSRHHPGT
jgi:cyanophycin synthetase